MTATKRELNVAPTVASATASGVALTGLPALLMMVA